MQMSSNLQGHNLIIGVFISPRHAQCLLTQNKEFINSHRYIRYLELAKANRSHNILLYFFTHDDVYFDKQTVAGIFYNREHNSWHKNNFPFPHYLYDRGGGRGKKAEHIITVFSKLGIKNINARHYFDKWDLYEKLTKIDAVSSYLPFTVPGDYSLIPEMLARYGHIYVKARRGSCGLGVMRLEELPDKQNIRFYYSRFDKLFSNVLKKEKIPELLQRFFAHHPFIIQEPINLLKKHNRIVDFRSEVQRNGEGNLVITGTTARIGRPRSPIASNTYAEDYYPLNIFFKKIMKFNNMQFSLMDAKINHFLKTVFLAVEEAYGSFAEIGIDFGLDTNGRPWLIECNSKSARVALYLAYGRQKVRQSFCNLLDYAGFLAESKAE